ncbi:MAG: heme ABC exporter ATP-binding protein CcmA [Pseudomonadota bacterium]
MDGDLSVEGLSVARGGRRLLSGVSLAVTRGTALSLHGRNGLGKTSLLRVLAGLLDPAEGRLIHDPEKTAYSGHGDAIKASLTVAEMLGFWADLYGAASIEPALLAFDLDAIAGRRGEALSAGQRRRCALARLALVNRPIWLLDEPTAALDQAGQAELCTLLSGHLNAGGSALLVTHGAPPIDCPRLDLEAFRATPGEEAGAFAEALE